MSDPFGSSPLSSCGSDNGTRPKTPDLPKSDIKPPQPGTPVSANMAGTVPHTSTHSIRHATYTALQGEICEKVVGPMPAQTFLDNFLLPSNRVAKLPNARRLQKIRDASSEEGMYPTFIAAFGVPSLSNLEFNDSHSVALEPLQGSLIKPDLTIIDDQSQRQVKVRLEDIGIMGEMKYHKGDDPFDDENPEFEKTTGQAIDTLGQICAYATAHMAAQFRTHIFSLLIFPTYTRILRWDRSGVIVTAAIPFTSPEQALPLSEFFWRYNHASPTQRGVDPNVERLLQSGIESLPLNVRQSLGGSGAVSFYRFTFPPHRSEDQEKHYVVAAPYYMGTVSPVGRATRSFKAYCEDSKKFVFLKDSWRVLDGSLIPEHETYAKLAGAEVKHVATMANYHDMKDQETQTAKFKTFYKCGSSHPNKFRRFRHYRLVLDQYAKSIEQFTDVRELMQAFCDALQAHREAYEKAKVLHRDISAGNIMIDEQGRGLLIDWDLSKPTSEEASDAPRLPERTGTWQFIAYRLVQKRKKGEPVPSHNKDDDLESFWYVLFWVALRRCEHPEHNDDILSTLRRMFDDKYKSEGFMVAPTTKLLNLRNPDLVDEWSFTSTPLRTVLADIQAAVVLRYVLKPEQIATTAELWAETQKKFKTKPSAAQAELIKDLKMRLVEADMPVDSLLPARTLVDSNWAEKILDQQLNSAKVDWETGGGNKERLGLDVRNHGSEKRKSCFAEEEERRSKRMRINSGLPSIEENGEVVSDEAEE